MQGKKRWIVAISLGAACGAGVAAAVSAVRSTAEDETSVVSLGSGVKSVTAMSTLPRAAADAAARLAATTRDLEKQTPASEVYQLATFRDAGVVVMAVPNKPDRVCLATTGRRTTATCLDGKDLLFGRTVLSVPLVQEKAGSIASTPRVDFFVVPDEVVGVTTSDGTTVPSQNVAIVERPRGGPLGTVTYELSDGRRVGLAFASASP